MSNFIDNNKHKQERTARTLWMTIGEKVSYKKAFFICFEFQNIIFAQRAKRLLSVAAQLLLSSAKNALNSMKEACRKKAMRCVDILKSLA